MKVLFAVSNDTINTSIVNKYQQTYKEIVTSKNVYYFNAIVKELQNDKSYDCIIIEEDLEPISNNNYEAIDKFLFEKLDSISDEASKATGEDIPIILICSDRRTKSDDLLRKLFSMSIYNALVGDDRSLDKVCSLMSKPRNKKEAKKYYQIEGEQVEYEAHREEIVSEEQIQNILNYYKKIGNNERKCVQAFDSIAKQYDSTQLRIIVKFLPMDVKAILESNSSTYQRLMSSGTVLSNGQFSQYTPNNPKKPEKIDFITKNVDSNTKMDRPVVIPSNMNYQQSRTNNSINNQSGMYQNNQTSMQQFNNNNINQSNNRNVNQPNYYNNQYNQYGTMQNPYGNNYRSQNNNLYGMGQQMYNNRQPMNPYYNNVNTNPYGYQQNANYGTLQNNIQPSNTNNSNLQNINNQNEETKSREKNDNNINNSSLIPQKDNSLIDGVKPIEPMKPLKQNKPDENISEKKSDSSEAEQVKAEPVKKRRGRPKKIKSINEKDVVNEKATVEPVKKKRRGRPRKVKNQIEDINELNTTESQNLNKEHVTSNQNKIITSEPHKEIIQENNLESISNIDNEKKPEDRSINLYDLDISTTDPITNNSNSIYDNNLTNGATANSSTKQDDSIFNVSNNVLQDNSPYNANNNVPISNQAADFNTLVGNNDEINKNSHLIQGNQEISQNDASFQQALQSNPVSGVLQGMSSTPDTTIQNNPIQNNIIQDVSDNLTSNSTMLIKKETSNEDLEMLKNATIAGNGKIVVFVGTSKNGTSFIINNIAQMLSQDGINTAILDATNNKNSYYMYTDNDPKKVKVAADSLKNLSQGTAKGLVVKNNLTVFTSLPDQIENDNLDHKTAIDTLSKQYDVVLVDCDFKTDLSYFVLASEIYLIQSMDALTIQPLTKFLSDLKLKNILDETKLKVVINKYIKLKKLDDKMIVGGMSKYNEPSMTLQRDLFNPRKMQTFIIPFDDQTYFKYLESVALCQFSLNGFSKEVIDALEKLKNVVYPLIAGSSIGNNNYTDYTDYNTMGYTNQTNSQQFSNNVNDTLNKMRTNNF